MTKAITIGGPENNKVSLLISVCLRVAMEARFSSR